MTSQAIVADSIGFGVRVSLDYGDGALIMQGVVVSTTNSVAVHGLSGNNSVIIDGTISASSGGIYLGDAITDYENAVYVSKTGTVSATGSGISITAKAGTVTNDGYIAAASGTAIYFNTPVSNYWGGGHVYNTGTIIGRYGISASGGNLEVENSGTIMTTRMATGYVEDAIRGGDGNDKITNSGLIIGPVSLNGGRDTFDTSAGQTKGSVRGGDGNDTLTGSKYADDFSGDGDGDYLYGNAGNDYLSGGAGSDYIDGGSGNDSLNGGEDNDTLDGGTGNDSMQGGLGDDIYYIDSVKDSFYEAAGEGADTVYTRVSLTLSSNAEIEALYYNPYLNRAEQIFDKAKNISLTGNSFAQFISTAGPASGNDRLDGGGGGDTLMGSLGNDTYVIDGRDTIFEYENEGIDTVLSSASYTLASDLEKLTLTGSAGLTGKGNSLSNTITGNTGNNKLYGGLGKDVLVGGAGKDSFVFDTKLGSTNIDTINDFIVKDDTILLDEDIFTKAGKVGDLVSAAFYIGTAAHDSSDRVIYDKASGKLWYDADGSGSGAAIQFALLDKGLALAASDFDIIG